MNLKAQKKDYIHYLVALLIGLVLAFAIKPTNGLTEIGVRVIAILVPTLYLWLTVDTSWTCLLALGMLVCTQALTANEVWAGSMGHFVVITVIAYMILNFCLTDTGVINKIAMWFVTRKFVKGRPYAFLGMFFASNIIIGLFMDNLSLAVIYVAIAGVLCEQMGLKKGDSLYTAIFTGVLWGNVILSIASPIAHSLPNIVMGLCESQLGITISYAQWLSVGVPFSAIMWVVIMVCIRLWNPDTTAFKNFDVEAVKKQNPPLDARGKFAAVVFVLVVIFVLAPSLLKNVFPTVMGYLGDIGVTVPALFGIVALAIVPIKGERILHVPSAMKRIPLEVVIFAGTVSLFAVPISSEATGISIWLGNLFSPLVAGIPPFGIVVILMIFAILMTNFMSNTVTMVLFFNIGAALLAGGSTNMGVFTIIISLAAGMATITPSAAVPSPLFFGPGHVTMKNTLKWNLIFVVLSFVVLVVMFPICSAIMK